VGESSADTSGSREAVLKPPVFAGPDGCVAVWLEFAAPAVVPVPVDWLVL
jgi:hypothetical protein